MRRAESWKDRAACVGMPLTVFFPPLQRGRLGNDAAYAPALTVCRRCSVVSDCLREALDKEASFGREKRHGVYGGATPQQRAAMYREGRL